MSFPHKPKRGQPGGFALVVTLTLLVLLSILALGLLSLSSISLRSAAAALPQTTARANARLALMIAIGRLQEEMGPDRRINFPANQLADVPDGHRHWMAVQDSWNSADTETRPDPATTFRRWLVSGTESFTEIRDSAKSAPASSDITLFSGENTTDQVSVPKVLLSENSKSTGAYAWWVSDENSKALVSPAEQPDGLATAWSRAQSPASTGFLIADDLATLTDPVLEKLPTHASLDPATGIKGVSRRNFHHFTTFSQGLFTDAARGGLRKDLSLFLDYPKAPSPLPVKLPNEDRIYPDGITWEELWLYHNIWQDLQPPVAGLASMTGGNLTGAQMLITPPGSGQASQDAFMRDPFSLYKRITHINLQFVSSLWAKKNPSTDPADPGTYQICWVTDPVVTLWNPFDTPIALHPDSYYSLKYWTIPYTISVYRDGLLATRKTFNELSISNTNDHIFSVLVGTAPNPYRGRIGTPDPVVLMPGEVLTMSEGIPGEPLEYFKGDVTTQYVRKSLAMRAGWNLGRGRYVKIPGVSNVKPTERLEIEINPDNTSIRNDPGFGLRTLNFPYSYGRDRGLGDPPSVNVGFTELWGYKAYLPPGKPASQYPEWFKPIPRRQLPSPANFTGNDKEYIMTLSLRRRTEESETSWNRFNSIISSRDNFLPDDPRDIATNPFTVDVRPLSGLTHPDMPQSGPSHPNRGLFGGSTRNLLAGQDIVVTHAIPREPPISLGAFQHAIANGNTERMAYGALNPSFGDRSEANYVAPVAPHAISNSYAFPIFAPAATRNAATSGRPLEMDHSWHANRALWDSTFLSSITQRQSSHHLEKKTAKEVFSEFAQSGGNGRLPNPNIVATFTDPQTATDLLFDSSGKAKPEAPDRAASLLTISGAFNVNSTSIEAWKALLASANKSTIPVAPNPNQPGQTEAIESEKIPVHSLLTPSGLTNPESAAFDSTALSTPNDRAQWRGYRGLSETETEDLAKEMVEQVKAYGPFLSLADFINRRPGNDKDLAFRGPLQTALDKTVNDTLFAAPDRIGTAPAAAGFPFPEAAALPKSHGTPSHVLQADILTTIGPQLTVHSDTFRIRAYGEARDKNNTTTARAWCEATVQRTPEYTDPTQPAYEIPTPNTPNQTFGRKFQITSFRWLNKSEI